MKACKRKISASKYFAHPAVSRSNLFKMVEGTPAHYKHALETPEETTKAEEFGIAFHMAVLEPAKFKRNYGVMPRIDGRLKEARVLHQELIDSGKKILSADDYEAITGMQKSIFENKCARNLLAGEKEISYFWTDEFTGIDCKCRADCRTDSKTTSAIVDLKTCNNAATDVFIRKSHDLGYYFQAAYYKTGIEAVTGKPHEFVFIAVEKTPPYLINILKADEKSLLKGYDDMRECLGKLKRCRETGNYYGYMGEDGIPNILSLPPRLAKEYE